MSLSLIDTSGSSQFDSSQPSPRFPLPFASLRAHLTNGSRCDIHCPARATCNGCECSRSHRRIRTENDQNPMVGDEQNQTANVTGTANASELSESAAATVSVSATPPSTLHSDSTAAIDADTGNGVSAAAAIMQLQETKVNVRRILSRSHLLSHLPLADWKMNLMCCSPDGRYLFIVSGSMVLCCGLTTEGIPLTIARHRMERDGREVEKPRQEGARDSERRDTSAAPSSLTVTSAATTHPATTSSIPSTPGVQTDGSLVSNADDGRQTERTTSDGDDESVWAELVQQMEARVHADAEEERRGSNVSHMPTLDQAGSFIFQLPRPLRSTARHGQENDADAQRHQHGAAADNDEADGDDDDDGINDPFPPDFNVIRCGFIGFHPVLMATTMAGQLWIWDLTQLCSHGSGQGCLNAEDAARLIDPPIVRSHRPPLNGLDPRAALGGREDHSAWSVACTPRGSTLPRVAIGSNAHCAYLWKMAHAHLDNIPIQPIPPPPDDFDAEDHHSFTQPSIARADHNVPSVAFSSCSRFLAYASIDGLFRIARCSDGSSVATTRLEGQWGWNVRFIRREWIRRRSCTLQQMRHHREHATTAAADMDDIRHLQPVIQRHRVRGLRRRARGASASTSPDPAALEIIVEDMVQRLVQGRPIPEGVLPALRQHIRRLMERRIRGNAEMEEDGVGDDESGESEQSHGDEDGEEDDDEEEHEEDEDDDDWDAENEMAGELEDHPLDRHDVDDEDASATGSYRLLPDRPSTQQQASLLDSDESASSEMSVRHDEMGWEAGFEDEDQQQHQEQSDGEDDAIMQQQPLSPPAHPHSRPASAMGMDEAVAPSHEDAANTTSADASMSLSAPPASESSHAAAASTGSSAAVGAEASAPNASTQPAAHPPPNIASHHRRRRSSSENSSGGSSRRPSHSRTHVHAQPRRDVPSDLLIYSDKTNIYLLDGGLRELARVEYVCSPTLTIYRQLDRLLFVEPIPELNTILLASSASDRVLLYRINQYACGSYEFEVECALPSKSSGIPIKGLCVCRIGLGDSIEYPSDSSSSMTLRQAIMKRMEKDSVEDRSRDHGPDQTQSSETPPSYEKQDRNIEQQKLKPSHFIAAETHPPVASPALATSLLASRLHRWRVYILFADERLAVYELSYSSGDYLVDIATLAVDI